MKRVVAGAVVLILLVVAVLAWRPNVQAAATKAGSYPTKAVTLVVTFPPGGGTDLLARKLGAELEKRWRTPVIIENRPGASGNIGARYVADSKADGYTLLMVNSSFAINPGVYRQLGFDPKKDFEPIIHVAWIPSVIVVGENSPVTDLTSALQQSQAGSVAFASCGNGTPQHLAGEMLAERTGTTMLHIPYRGCGPAITDIMSGQVPLGIVTLSSAMGFIESGKLKPVAITAATRSPVMPDIPTVMEYGIENYQLDQWHGLLAPAGTPAELITQLNQTIVKLMEDEKIQHDLKKLGYTPFRTTADEFKRIIHADIDRFAALTTRVGLKIN